MTYKEKDEAKVKEFVEIISKVPPELVTYLDECGMEKFIYREYGRALRGTAVYGRISGKKYKRVGVAAGQCCADCVRRGNGFKTVRVLVLRYAVVCHSAERRYCHGQCLIPPPKETSLAC